jgi:hypothetical protein
MGENNLLSDDKNEDTSMENEANKTPTEDDSNKNGNVPDVPE